MSELKWPLWDKLFIGFKLWIFYNKLSTVNKAINASRPIKIDLKFCINGLMAREIGPGENCMGFRWCAGCRCWLQTEQNVDLFPNPESPKVVISISLTDADRVHEISLFHTCYPDPHAHWSSLHSTFSVMWILLCCRFRRHKRFDYSNIGWWPIFPPRVLRRHHRFNIPSKHYNMWCPRHYMWQILLHKGCTQVNI